MLELSVLVVVEALSDDVGNGFVVGIFVVVVVIVGGVC
jgi:hypothetical protein